MTVRGANYPRLKNDAYETPPEALDALFENVKLGPMIFDPACGKHRRVVKAARRHGLTAAGSDIAISYPRADFLNMVNGSLGSNDIVTNPPFGTQGRMALRFIEQALEVTNNAQSRVALLLPVDFDSGKTRRHVFGDCQQFALKLVLLDRIKWFNEQSGSINHAWFVWSWRHKGPPIIKYARIK